MSTVPTTERQEHIARHNLTTCGDWSEQGCATSVKALLFEQMVKRALPIVKFYLGDLYHDVQWMDKYLAGDDSFYHSVRQTGTSIGADPTLVSIGAERMWHVFLGKLDSGWWVGDFVEVDPEAELDEAEFHSTVLP